MSKKLIIFLTVDALIIASLFIANNAIGARVESSVEEQLQIIFTENAANAPFQFEYDEVKANPFGRSVTISGFKVIGDDFAPLDMEAESVKLKMPLSEILGLARNKELKSINKMSIDLQRPVFKSEDSDARFMAKSMKMTFKGEASLFEMERMDNGFLPSTKQSIDLHFQDMGWDGIEDLMSALPAQVQSAMGSTYSQTGDFRLTVEYDPYKKQINLKRWEMDGKTTSAKGQAVFNFTGESFNDFEPKNGHVEMSYDMAKVKEAFPELGEYSLKKASIDFELDLDFANLFNIQKLSDFSSLSPLKSLNFNMNIEGLKLTPSENLNDTFSQLGTSVDLSTFSMNRMALAFNMTNKKMELGDLTLKLENLLDLSASAKMSYEVMPNQGFFGDDAEVLVFDKAHLELESKSVEIDGFIRGMEESMPKPFPRKNGKLIIDLSGPITNPTIKGVTD